MIKRGKLFVTGVILFVAGFIVPFIIGLILDLTVAKSTIQFFIRDYGLSAGFLISIFIGLPLILLGILLKPKENREE